MIQEILQLQGLVDTHAHINSKKFDLDRDQIITNARDNKLVNIFDIGTDITSSRLSIDIASRSDGLVKSFVGIDPDVFIPGSELELSASSPLLTHPAPDGAGSPLSSSGGEGWGEEALEKWFSQQKKELSDLIEAHREFIAGIGETGMDYYWIENKFKEGTIAQEDINHSKENQERLFRMHIELAEQFELPLTIHSRGTEPECLEIITKSNTKGIFHSYTGDYDTAKRVIDAGCGLGVNGIITFKNARELRAVYKKLLGKVSTDWAPEDFYNKGIFFETDCPYLAPEGKRGERNEPANVKDVFEQFVALLN